MSTPAKLKKQALQHEHDRHYDKALAIYTRLLDEPGSGGDEEVDVALFNRAGDLALRAGDAVRAVTYYERAVDLYAAGGLLNNAIALCNKILRHAPDRVSAHYSLGVLNAKQGFRGDAKFHFVEYADRMHRAGRDDEALRALREFAELCAPGDDARALLAQHLLRTGKGSQSATTLQAVFDAGVPAAGGRFAAPNAGGRSAPAAEPDAERFGAASLVFLDLNGDSASAADADVPTVDGFETGPGIDASVPDGAPASLDLLDTGNDASAWPTAVDGLETTAWDADAFGGSIEVDAPEQHPVTTDERSLPEEWPGSDSTLDAPSLTGTEAVALEPLDADDLALVPDGGPELMLLTFDAPDDLPDHARDETSGDDTDLPSTSTAVVDEPLAFIDLDADASAIELPLLVDDASLPEPVAVTTSWAAETSPAILTPPIADATEPPAAAATAAVTANTPDDGLDLGAWLRETEAPASTRMVTTEPSQTGDEQADFDRMLDAFKAGVERNVDGEDYESHYDLGVAFREMGLLDEAIAQFQRASRAPGRPLRALEALGECFVDLGQPELALEALGRAAGEGAASASALPDEQLVGVLYLLGVASEQTQRSDAAGAYYRRVLAIDIRFRDAGRRLAQLLTPPR